MESALMATAIDGFEQRLGAVGATQWNAATPCDDWDVRTLVNHVVGELLWMPPLLEGKTIAEVGDRFDGDVLGSDPLATFKSAAAAAHAAASRAGRAGANRPPLVRRLPGRVSISARWSPT